MPSCFDTPSTFHRKKTNHDIPDPCLIRDTLENARCHPPRWYPKYRCPPDSVRMFFRNCPGCTRKTRPRTHWLRLPEYTIDPDSFPPNTCLCPEARIHPAGSSRRHSPNDRQNQETLRRSKPDEAKE